MTSDIWPPCIVTAFDLIGTCDNASKGLASSVMREMHQFAEECINTGLSNHCNGYIWNDSVLLLSYITEPSISRHAVLMELSKFKLALEQRCGVRTYAISIRGLGFPQNEIAPSIYESNTVNQSRAVVLKTSSWAMANCFLVEKELKKHKADWYIDSRITKNVKLPTPFAAKEIALLQKRERRKINMYKGYLHAMD